jgi:hypothetical protein
MTGSGFAIVTQASSLSGRAGILPARDGQDARRTNSHDGCITEKEAK